MSETFTWADLKALTDQMSLEELQQGVHGWPDGDEGGVTINGFMKTEEDYYFDGEEHCCPKADVVEFDPEINHLVHKQGTVILLYSSAK
jgi:hypothetical protein